MPKCTTCNLNFRNDALQRQHLLQSKNHFYCNRCSRDFPSKKGLNQHRQTSRNHWYCHKCYDEPDYPTNRELRRHQAEKHNFCIHCDDFYPQFKSPKDMQTHKIEEHSQCTECKKFFWEPAELRAHQIAQGHGRIRGLKCFGCDKIFQKLSAMIIHLESGMCPSGIDEDGIDQVAIHEHSGPECYTTELKDDEGEPWTGYRCPVCPRTFAYMSGLLQHAEGRRCVFHYVGHEPLIEFQTRLEEHLANPNASPASDSVSDDAEGSDDPDGAPLDNDSDATAGTDYDGAPLNPKGDTVLNSDVVISEDVPGNDFTPDDNAVADDGVVLDEYVIPDGDVVPSDDVVPDGIIVLDGEAVSNENAAPSGEAISNEDAATQDLAEEFEARLRIVPGSDGKLTHAEAD